MPDDSLIRAFGQQEQANQSPFDIIRRIDENGQEYWLARELMKLLGYTKWQRFEYPITQAIENLELNGDDVTLHFTATGKLSSVSNPVPLQDYKLSRYGCYMVALCCDGRKPEVALAKKYFATKARQAEVSEQQPKLPQTFAEALRAYADELEAKERLEKENKILVGENNLLSEDNDRLAEAVDELFDYSSIIRVAKYNQVSEKRFSWHRLKAVSAQLNAEIKKVPCPRYVSKNLYSHDVWRLAYPDISLPETTVIRLVP